jgi:hypothetical protein
MNPGVAGTNLDNLGSPSTLFGNQMPMMCGGLAVSYPCHSNTTSLNKFHSEDSNVVRSNGTQLRFSTS